MRLVAYSCILLAAGCVDLKASSGTLTITGFTGVTCTTTDQPGDFRDYTCQASVSGKAEGFEPDDEIVNVYASIDVPSGAFYDQGLSMSSETTRIDGPDASIQLTVTSSGTVHDEAPCTAGSITGITVVLNGELDLGDGIFQGLGESVSDASISVACP